MLRRYSNSTYQAPETTINTTVSTCRMQTDGTRLTAVFN
jgi:hypothetical protein